MNKKEIRELKERKCNTAALMGNIEVARYIEEMYNYFMELYNEGSITNFSKDFLRFVNGYQVTNNQYEELSVLQTYDLHRISATKKITRRMIQEFLK